MSKGTPADPLREEILAICNRPIPAGVSTLDGCTRKLQDIAALATKPAELPAIEPSVLPGWGFDAQGHVHRVHPTESAGKSPEAVDETRIEAAYWEFDARHKGYSPFTFKRSERDAFKQTIRRMLNGGEAIP